MIDFKYKAMFKSKTMSGECDGECRADSESSARKFLKQVLAKDLMVDESAIYNIALTPKAGK